MVLTFKFANETIRCGGYAENKLGLILLSNYNKQVYFYLVLLLVLQYSLKFGQGFTKVLLNDYFSSRLAKCGFYKLCQWSKEESESEFSNEELSRLVNHPRIPLSTELIQEIVYGIYFLMYVT